jgi:hypothetical protein
MKMSVLIFFVFTLQWLTSTVLGGQILVEIFFYFFGIYSNVVHFIINNNILKMNSCKITLGRFSLLNNSKTTTWCECEIFQNSKLKEKKFEK